MADLHLSWSVRYVEVWDGEPLAEGSKCLVRRELDDTDIGEHENFDRFTARHGGIEGTLAYLRGIRV